MFEKESYMIKGFKYLDTKHDQLFNVSYDHENVPKSCNKCDSLQMSKDWEVRETTDPQIHYETIISVNQVMCHDPTRDKVVKDLSVICFDMKTTSLMNNFLCLVIRDICNYVDTYKNKRWQDYVVATVVVFTKELLEFIPRQKVIKMTSICKFTSNSVLFSI